MPGEKGAYWFNGGFNPRAWIAWLVASGVGLLFTETSIITGPLPKHIDNIDLSFTSAAIVGGVLYYVLLRSGPSGAWSRATSRRRGRRARSAWRSRARGAGGCGRRRCS